MPTICIIDPVFKLKVTTLKQAGKLYSDFTEAPD